jgi:hypothetical protein
MNPIDLANCKQIFRTIIMLKYLIFTLMFMNLNAGENKQLIDFEMEDQFDAIHKRSDYKTKVIIIVGSDRKGSDYNPLWVNPLVDSLKAENIFDKVSIIGVAELGSVPFFMRGIVQGFFPDDTTNRILMDWDSAFAEEYAFVEDQSNLAVFGPGDKLLYQTAVTEFDPTVFKQFYGEIKRIIAGLASE